MACGDARRLAALGPSRQPWGELNPGNGRSKIIDRLCHILATAVQFA